MTSWELKERVLRAAREEPSPTRAVVRERDLVRVIAALGVALTVFVVSRGVRVGERPLSLVVGTALGAAALATVIGGLALGRGRSMLGRTQSMLWAVAILSPAALLAWKVGWTAHYGVFGPMCAGFRCFGLSLGMGAAPFTTLLIARRRSDPLHPAGTGAAVGTAVAAFAWVLVDLWCPVGYVQHLLFGHVLPCFIFIVGGAVIGRSYVAVR